MLNSRSSDPSQTDRQSRRTSKIGGAQLQYIFIHFKLVSGSNLKALGQVLCTKHSPSTARTDGRTKVEISKTPKTYSKPLKRVFRPFFLPPPPPGWTDAGRTRQKQNDPPTSLGES